MNKIDDAWAVLKKLSPREQEFAAEAILDYASRAPDLGLSEVQARDVQQRLKTSNPKTLTPAELKLRLNKFTQ
ncbi:MAG TPA: hypothetical protein VFI93_11930 [Rhizomicrobium sp.]|jgi:hypothetical protein|nr:hypothetical protein [Rhizomicrobium sp.]